MQPETNNHFKGYIQRYDITAKTWKDITPVSGSDLYFGFG